MNNRNTILCIGEVLWDALPHGLFLGGAPLNVCCHLNRMGVNAEIISCVGNDRLGKEAIRKIQGKGVDTEMIQTDPVLETGFVSVELDKSGDPRYEIISPVAWDYIRPEKIPTGPLRQAWGIVFGSLAQRGETSRVTILELLKMEVVKIFDMNLRPPYDTREIVEESLHHTDILKLNEDELNQVIEWFSLPGDAREAVDKITEKFDCQTVCVTRGGRGALLYRDESWTEHTGYPVTVRDAVGAGDAFLAALLYGIQRGTEGEELLKLANAAGALVAQKDGATPDYEMQSILEMTGE